MRLGLNFFTPLTVSLVGISWGTQLRSDQNPAALGPPMMGIPAAPPSAAEVAAANAGGIAPGPADDRKEQRIQQKRKLNERLRRLAGGAPAPGPAGAPGASDEVEGSPGSAPGAPGEPGAPGAPGAPSAPGPSPLPLPVPAPAPPPFAEPPAPSPQRPLTPYEVFVRLITPCFRMGSSDPTAISDCVTAKFNKKTLDEDQGHALHEIAYKLRSMSMKELMEYAAPYLAKALEDALYWSVEIEALKYVPEVLRKAKAAARASAADAVEKATPAVAQAVAQKAVNFTCTHTLSAVAEYSVQYVSTLFPAAAARTRSLASLVAKRDITNPESVQTCANMASDVIRYIAMRSVQGAEILAEQTAWDGGMQKVAEDAAKILAQEVAESHRQLWRQQIEHSVEDAVRSLGEPVQPDFPTPAPLSAKARKKAAEASEEALAKCLANSNPLDILQVMGCHSGASAATIAMDKIPTAIEQAFNLLRGCPQMGCPSPAPGPAPGGLYSPAPAPVMPNSPASFMTVSHRT